MLIESQSRQVARLPRIPNRTGRWDRGRTTYTQAPSAYSRIRSACPVGNGSAQLRESWSGRAARTGASGSSRNVWGLADPPLAAGSGLPPFWPASAPPILAGSLTAVLAGSPPPGLVGSRLRSHNDDGSGCDVQFRGLRPSRPRLGRRGGIGYRRLNIG